MSSSARTVPSKLSAESTAPQTATAQPITITNPIQTLSTLRRDVSRITSANVVPEELAVLELLNRVRDFSNVIVYGQSEPPTAVDIDATSQPTSSILDDLEETVLEKKKTATTHNPTARGMSVSFRTKAADTLCELVYNLVRDPKVFISPPILQVYTRVQCLLGKPEYLPEIFYLFAHKPIPQPKTSPIRYTNPWPNSPKNAVPLDLADAALECAIRKKDMPLAIAIIDTTVATRAFKFDKVIRQASLPALAVSATPVIAYAGATWLSTYQNVWDPEMAKYTAIAGSMAYIGTLTTIGFVAVTTWNDHMQRVVWAIGTPLTARWLREDERAYLDKIALAWGFQERWRRGEEQGEEWENLRELIGMRSMILDKTELMDGME